MPHNVRVSKHNQLQIFTSKQLLYTSRKQSMILTLCSSALLAKQWQQLLLYTVSHISSHFMLNIASSGRLIITCLVLQKWLRKHSHFHCHMYHGITSHGVHTWKAIDPIQAAVPCRSSNFCLSFDTFIHHWHFIKIPCCHLPHAAQLTSSDDKWSKNKAVELCEKENYIT